MTSEGKLHKAGGKRGSCEMRVAQLKALFSKLEKRELAEIKCRNKIMLLEVALYNTKKVSGL